MRTLLHFLFFLVLLTNLAQAIELEACGQIGEIQQRLDHCFKINGQKKIYTDFLLKNFQLLSFSLEKGMFLYDKKTGLSWGEEMPMDSPNKCSKPYKKAKRRHYKKVKGRGIEQKKRSFRCIANLKDWVLIPKNRYLYF